MHLKLSVFSLIVLLCGAGVRAYAQPKAAFSVDTTQGCAPVLVHFTDASAGATSWRWDFGNGSTSTQQNPGAVYLQPGVYTVKLVVYNAQGADSVIKPGFINVFGKPDIRFTATPAQGCAPLPVQFSQTSGAGSGSIQSLVWDFGDGQISAAVSPLHVYAQPGSYNVSLTATNSYGCTQSLQQPALVNITPKVSAAFNYTYANACRPPTAVSFSNTTATPLPATYRWSFGDGGTATDSLATHSYVAAGDYTIQLVATANGCADSVKQTINIGNAKAGFTTPATACVNSPVSFTNTSSPSPKSAAWQFGDGATSANQSPLHSYAAAGSYQVKLVVGFGACQDSAVQNIVVSGKPITAFTVSPPSSACTSTASVQFTNQTTGASGFKWLFGDGTTSGDVNPSHTYTRKGYYTVTLISFNGNGCSDTLVQTNAVHIGPPYISGISNLPYTHCAPGTVSMNAVTDGSQAITSYLWNFGDGTTGTDAAPSHTYTTAGSYNVSVILQTSSGCSDTFSLQKAVTLLPSPDAAFSANPLALCGKKPITFTDASTGEKAVVNWLWNFGDGSTSAVKNPVHSYADTGYFSVTLIVGNGQCFDTLPKLQYIHIDGPIAKYTTLFDCGSKYVRSFKDQSIAADSWFWKFGDGNTSTEQNPTHTYAATGDYSVTLIVTNATCTDSLTTLVHVVNEQPTFTYTPTNTALCRNQRITFAATSYNAAAVQAFNWNFGDGQSSGFINSPGSYHGYSTAGNYTVTLQVKDINQCITTATQTLPLQVYGPKAAFTNDKGTCLQKGLVHFTDQSTTDGTHPITAYTWNFGDGNTQNFTSGPAFDHSYQQAGNFAVKLVVTDSYGCSDSLTKQQAVIITDPKAAFALSDSIRCPRNSINFTNQSTGSPVSYTWYFGDGTQSTQATPQHNYADTGHYTVALKVTDMFGCTDSVSKPAVVAIAYVRASFNEPDTFINCPPLVVTPQNTSSNASVLSWNFGDGVTSTAATPQHVYTMGGIYTLTLVAQGYGTCVDTATKIITVKGPSGSFVYTPQEGCNPTSIAFKASTKNTVSLVWDFADGITLPGTDSLVGHTYNQSGQYTPKLVLTDSANCRVGITGTVPITIADVVAGFAYKPLTGCDSSLVAFTDTSQVAFDHISSYSWNFGDNSATETNATAMHYYTQSGSYNVQLTVASAKGCTDTLVVPVKVVVHPRPDIAIQAPDSACIFSTVNFTATNARPEAISSWQWLYGNGSNGNTQQSSYAYNTAGVYPVQLIAVNEFGCADTAQQGLTILALPPLDAGLDTVVCYGQPLQLQGTGANSYAWSASPGATLSCTQCANPLASLALPSRFYVTGRSAFGCVAYDSLFADVKMPFQVHAMGTDSICVGASVQLKSYGAELYQWSPAASLSNPYIANPVAAPQQTTVYELIGTDNHHCFADTQQVKITVFPIPVFNIIDSNLLLSVGSADTLRTFSSPDITRWQWSPTQSLSCADCPSPIAAPINTITYTARASNPGGCSTVDKVTIQVLCNGANIYMPNTFSPNHDGMNDQFYPRGKGLSTIKSLRIFNRWGQLIFTHTNFQANAAADGWDGTFNGHDVPADVYVYIMEVQCENNTVINVKGNIALLR